MGSLMPGGLLTLTAGATVFLASEKASGFATGVSTTVDGGYLAHKSCVGILFHKIHFPFYLFPGKSMA